MQAALPVVLSFLTVALAADKKPAPAKDKDAAKPAWTMNLADMKVPDHKPTGIIHGKEFKMERAELKGGVLTLRQGSDHFPDLGLDVMMFIQQDENPDGKKLRIAPEETGKLPWLRLQWREKKNEGLPQTEHFKNGYAFILELGPRKDGKLTGRIYACLPDEHKSVVAGTFTVDELDKK